MKLPRPVLESDEEYLKVALRRHEALRQSASKLYWEVAAKVYERMRSKDGLGISTTPTRGST